MSDLGASQQPPVVGNATGWQAFYNERVKMRDGASDAATKTHFDAELEVARQNMKATDITSQEVGSAPDNNFPAYNAPDAGPKVKPDAGGSVPASGAGSFVPGDGTLSSDLGAMEPYRNQILKAAATTGLDPNLLAAVIWDESKGDPTAGTVNGGNGKSDSGLMQVNSDTYSALKAKHPDLLTGNWSDPQEQIMAGALYLKENIDKFGSVELGLRAYNSGPGSVDPSDHTISTTGLGTKNYVEKVFHFLDELNNNKPLSPGYPGGNVLY